MHFEIVSSQGSHIVKEVFFALNLITVKRTFFCFENFAKFCSTNVMTLSSFGLEMIFIGKLIRRP